MTITKRWFFSTILVIALVLAAFAAAVSFTMYSYYYDTVQTTVDSRCQSVGIANYFSSYLNAGGDAFTTGAKQYVEDFTYGNLMEVWVFDGNGEVIVTSTGFHSEESTYPDYATALQTESGKGSWFGQLRSGERVYALTVLLPKTEGVSNGAVRFVTSVEDVHTQWMELTLLLVSGCLFALSLVVLSGLYFIRSIVRPVKRLNTITRRIAAGDFSVKAELTTPSDEIGELCESINYMSGEIARTDKLKNDFISTVSHELRTPLTAIKGWSETLLTVVPPQDAEMLNGLRVISTETERLYSLVEDLLDFSKIENGRMSLRMAKMDALAELDEAVFVLKDRASRKGITIEYNAPEVPAPMRGDADRIKQVFVNLLDNAIKYTDSGGRISVAATMSQTELIINITDNGCGIAQEDLPRIKEKFYKANVAVKGSGIGLAVCDEILTRHGASFELSSKLGIGTEVRIRLPLLGTHTGE